MDQWPSSWVRRLLVGCSVVLALFSTNPALAAEAAGDHHGWLALNQSNVDRGHWEFGIAGTGVLDQVQGGQLQITIPGGTIPDPVQGFINVGMVTRCVVRGDYDVQVDYTLESWPPANGVQVLFGDAPPVNSHSIARGQYPNDAYLSFDSSAQVVAIAPTSDLQSTVRMIRNGAIVTTFFLANGEWVPLLSSPTQTGDTPFAIAALSFSTVTQEVKVSFSNFEVNAGQVVCPD
jgi:hypothetical protein